MVDQAQGCTIFRHFLVVLPYAGTFELVMLYGGYLIFRDPAVISPKGLLVALVWVGANVVLLDMIGKVWRTRWTFRLCTSHLVVSDPVKRRECDVQWATVVSVEKIPQYWWNRGGIQLNAIVLENGRADGNGKGPGQSVIVP